MRQQLFTDESVEVCGEKEEKYLDIIGYQGNNLLCSEWSEDQIEGLDFNGLYEYFYMEEYGREIDTEKCARGIPQEEFESLLTKYLPVTAEQLREYTSYDPENDTHSESAAGRAGELL